MKRGGPIVHGALLLVALLLAYQSWTRDKTEDKKQGKVRVWTKSADAVQAISFDTKDRTLRVERKSEGGASYLWGTETRVSKIRKPAGAAGAEPEFENKTSVKEFPVGEAGQRMFENFAELRALRDLGELDDDDKERYGIAESTDNITISFSDGDKSLILGGKIYGGSDRYLLDTATGKGYAVAAAVVAELNGGEASLRLSKLYAFEDDDLKQVRISAGGQEKTLVRTETMTEKGKTKGWADAATPDKPDQTTANFLDSLKSLRPVSYVAQVEGPPLEPVMTIDWQGDGQKPLGRVEIFKQVIPPPPEPEPPVTPPVVPGTPPAPGGATPGAPATPAPGGAKPAAPAGAKPTPAPATTPAPAGTKPTPTTKPATAPTTKPATAPTTKPATAPTTKPATKPATTPTTKPAPKKPQPAVDGRTNDPAGGEAKQPAPTTTTLKPAPTTKPAPTGTKPAPTGTKPAPTTTGTKPAPTTTGTKPAPTTTGTKPAPTGTKPAPTTTGTRPAAPGAGGPSNIPGHGTTIKPGEPAPPAGTPVMLPPEPPKKREPTVEYYVKSELTRIYGKIDKAKGERIEKDLKELLGK